MLAKVELAVTKVYREIYFMQSDSLRWYFAKESELLSELIACLLGSQVHFDVALAVTRKIKESGLLEMYDHLCMSSYESAINAILKQPIHQPGCPQKISRYRFPNTKANYIARTLRSIYSNGKSLKGYLQSNVSSFEARRLIIKLATGIGPKQASLYLRNIGFTDDLAILDTHVLKFMHLCEMINCYKKSISSIKTYEIIESELRKYAQQYDWRLGSLDLAIWIVMRVYTMETKK